MDARETNSSRHSSSRAPKQLRAKALVRGRRAAMRRRARRIRRSVATFAAALFSTAFLVIYVQLASGHDLALAANAKRARAQRTLVAGTSDSSTNSASTTTS
jgi:hypothetical protein